MNIPNNSAIGGKTQSNQGVNKHFVLASIEKASKKTGVDFSYLMEQAAAESSFNPTAKAKTSSAQGLYQFIDSTWLGMVKNYGAKHGMEKYADAIQKDSKGRYTITDPALKKEIMDARNNPEKASVMAAELAKSNEQYLKQHVPNAEIGKTELYFAHFMGANGAARFMNAMKNNPDANAAAIFKKEAAANKNVFFDAKTGKPRSLEQVYAFFDKKFDTDINAPKTQDVMVAEMKAQALKTKPATEEVSQQVAQQVAMMDGTPLFLSTMPEFNETKAASAGVGYTRRIDAQTLFFIQQLTNDMERTAFSDKATEHKANGFV